MSASHRLCTAGLSALLAFAAGSGLRAQDDDERFNQNQADDLHEFAEDAFKRGFPRQAKHVWLKLLKLYDPNYEPAREALGEKRIGDSWAPRSDFEYPTEDTGSGAAGQKLFKAYEKLKTNLARAHERQAKKWEKAQRADKSEYHWQMVLRWDKDNRGAQEALNHKEIGGVTGTDLEQTLYDRSKMIEKAVASEARKSYPAEPYSEPNQVLDTAQVEYVSFKSDHFILHGDPGQEELLKETLQWGERALRVVEVAFPWNPFSDAEAGGTSAGYLVGEFAYFLSKDTYKQILRAHADQVSDLEWMLENSSTSGLNGLAFGATSDAQTTYDALVRQVARRWAGFGTAGLTEGIGHTFVGMIFNNNRLFSVDRKKQEGTVASEEDREYQSPDFDVWKNLALEMAWRLTGGVPAVELPFVKASEFSNEARIKAWSFCDYVMRRDPTLLRTLDFLGFQQQQTGVKVPIKLEKDFEEATGGITIEQLEKEWEDFWTEATPVLAAIRNNTPPLKAVTPGVQQWLAAINEARKEAGKAPVTWSSNLSTRCFEHAEYLIENKKLRGPEHEHTEEVDLGGTHLGSMFAQQAVVETRANLRKADQMFEEWMKIPGYRDVIVNPYMRTIGLYEDKGVLVLNVVAGLGDPKQKGDGYGPWPISGKQGIPREVRVDLIGPELEELLAENGREGQRVVGYPMTMHFRSGLLGDPTSYNCQVEGPKGTIEGALLRNNGKIRRSTAPGMITFYPFDPLPPGQLNVRWSFRKDDGQLQTVDSRFTTR